MDLSPEALRVLGSLIEKEMTTPQGYPLSLNALRTACNQTTNREPVVTYDDATVQAAIKELTAQGLVRAAYAQRSSTPKYKHVLDQHLEIPADQVAILGVLMLRGPQTFGELRQRTDRMHTFAELADVARTLEGLRDHPFGALVEELPRMPGQKEQRWRHLLGGGAPSEVPSEEFVAAPTYQPAVAVPRPVGEMESLREEIAELRDDVETLQLEVERLRRLIEN